MNEHESKERNWLSKLLGEVIGLSVVLLGYSAHREIANGFLWNGFSWWNIVDSFTLWLLILVFVWWLLRKLVTFFKWLFGKQTAAHETEENVNPASKGTSVFPSNSLFCKTLHSAKDGLMFLLLIIFSGAVCLVNILAGGQELSEVALRNQVVQTWKEVPAGIGMLTVNLPHDFSSPFRGGELKGRTELRITSLYYCYVYNDLLYIADNPGWYEIGHLQALGVAAPPEKEELQDQFSVSAPPKKFRRHGDYVEYGEQYFQDREVTCYVNPENPGQSVLFCTRAGYIGPFARMMGGCILLMMIAVWGFCVCSRKTQRNLYQFFCA